MSVSLFEDTLVVGAPYESSKATGVRTSPEEQADNQALSSGAVYVFERTGSTWSQQAYIKASNTSAQDCFGLSVAAFGNTIAVGAPEQSTSVSGVPANDKRQDELIEESGAVFVFERAGATWVQQTYLKASHPSSEAWFGSSLALSVNTLAIGAPGESIGSGAVYIFERTGTAWSPKAHLKSSNASDDGSFGSSLAISKDTLAVGAVGESSSIVGTRRRLRAEVEDREEGGAGYVFRRTGSAWYQQAYIVASNAEQFDRLGASVALFDNNLVFGAIGEDSNAIGVAVSPGKHLDNNNGDDAGAAYLFNRKNGKWFEAAYLKASNTDDSHVP